MIEMDKQIKHEKTERKRIQKDLDDIRSKTTKASEALSRASKWIRKHCEPWWDK